MRSLLGLVCLSALACPRPSCERAIVSVSDAAVAPDASNQERAACEAQCAQLPDVEMDAWDDLPPEEAAEHQRNWIESEKEKLLRSPEYADCVARCAPK